MAKHELEENKKPINQVIIIISIVAVIAIILCIIGYFSWKKQTEQANSQAAEENQVQEENQLQEENSINENSVEDNIENEIGHENQTNTNTNSSDETPKTPNTNTNVSQGREEQESNLENQGENKEELAIRLAKEEWGTNSKAYDFVVDKVEGNIYTIAVRSANATGVTTIEYYRVDVGTKKIVVEE